MNKYIDVTPFPILPANILPLPTDSNICTRIFARGLLIALVMEAVRTSETSVCFNETTLCYIQEGCSILSVMLKLWLGTVKL
jgi:hypothetical protein